MKATHRHLTRNGYGWFCFEDGFHHFHKRVAEGWLTLKCTTDQIANGDFAFMADNDLTLE